MVGHDFITDFYVHCKLGDCEVELLHPLKSQAKNLVDFFNLASHLIYILAKISLFGQSYQYLQSQNARFQKTRDTCFRF